jgi:inner membrane protein
MYAEGHAGLTLAISSLLIIPIGDRYETTIFILAASLLASLPDIDLSLMKKGVKIHHRGPTHSILFAIICGLIMALLAQFLFSTLIHVIIGFLAGFIGIISHLLGDLLTFMALKPLWPFNNRSLRLGLVSSSNKNLNYFFVILGGICFVYYAST